MALVVVASDAHAQDSGMLPNGAMLRWDRLLIRENPDADLQEPSTPDALKFRLNAAACACSFSNPDFDTDLHYELALTMETGSGRPGLLYVGTQCEDPKLIDTRCRQVGTIADIDDLFTPENVSFRVYDIINASPELNGMPCRVDEGDATVWVLVDTDGDTEPDFFSPRAADLGIFVDQGVSGFDTNPPPLLEDVTATGGEESIEIKWTVPDSREEDFFAYQAFCMRDGLPVRTTTDAPVYSTVQTVCGLTPPELALEPIPLVDPKGTPLTDAPRELKVLDPAFLCGTQSQATATSLRIDGLENGAQYTIALVAVDFYGNPTGMFFTSTVVPKPVTDFWEDLHERGGGIEGGFCASSSPSSLAGVLLVLAALVLRKRRVIAPLLALALFAPSVARADDITPYWEDPGAEVVEDAVPKWRAGIRVGPYVPAIDSQIGRNAVTGLGPYAAMFGNYYTRGANGEIVPHDAHVYQVLPMLDVDRIIWSFSGQVTIGGSIGYMQKSGFAYAEDDNPNDDIENSPDEVFRIRSTAAENTFRLIPLALTVSYRATQLDDLYGIPIVPYLRGGLSYYIWWLTGPNGDVSKICTDGGMNTSTCEGNKARGGSFGLQGSVGLSVRAERIDADTARSMVNSGLYHAGFYVEYMFAKVDGFGSSNKLSVGDNTWFAGIDFEF